MRIFLRIFLLVSIVLVVFLLFKIFDAYTSIKYEIEELAAMGKANEALREKREYLEDSIAWVWSMLGYVALAITVGLCFLKSLPKRM